MSSDRIAKAVSDLKIDGVLTCPQAFAIAKKHKLPLKDIGEYCNANGIKIRGCQLSCFR